MEGELRPLHILGQADHGLSEPGPRVVGLKPMVLTGLIISKYKKDANVKLKMDIHCWDALYMVIYLFVSAKLNHEHVIKGLKQ